MFSYDFILLISDNNDGLSDDGNSLETGPEMSEKNSDASSTTIKSTEEV